MISRRYKRFEDTLYKIAESMRKTDPDRADLLVRAIGKSKEDRIGAQMAELAALLKDNKQLGDAVERQGDVVTQLHSLLDLLLNLTPALLQCLAALSERWPELAEQSPTKMGMGGIPDSCFMWRKGGALDQAREGERSEGKPPFHPS